MVARASKMAQVMWDTPLYSVNTFYYYWLIKKLLWPTAGQNIARWEIQAEIEEERRWSHGDARTLPVSHTFVTMYRLIEMG